MLINSIEIQNFRNYKNEKINLNPNINIFYGDNAQGKTNIIEAIFLSAFGKSFRTNKEKELIKIGEDFSNININYTNKVKQGSIKIQINDKKNITVNSIKIKKLSEILGNINVVLFTPDDINILKNGPSNRRKFLNMLIGQIRPNYIHNLNMYLKVLEQRNNYLKQVKNNTINDELFNIWDLQLAEFGEKISSYRKEFIEKIRKKLKIVHSEITQNKEDIEIEYITDSLNKEELLKKLQKNRKIDIIRGYTGVGIQRDDFIIYINKEPVNVYGSQGQHRTAILSLKLCELDIIKEEVGEEPILLLDDFMSELDDKRIKNFLNHIKNTQVIITCTKEIAKENINKTTFYVSNGSVKKK